MTNQTQNAVMTQQIKFEVNGEEVKLSGNTIKQYLVRGNGNVSDQETVMFMNLCKFQKLNPFLNEAYLIKFGSSPAQIIVSKEAFMKRAEGHEKYEGFEAGIIVEREGELHEIEGAVKLEKDILIGGWCKVYRSDRKVPVVTKIDYKEFSKNQATWKDMPMNMIRKSAVVNGLREAFPESLGALYTEEDKGPKPTPITEVEQEIKQNANQEIIDIQEESITPPVENSQDDVQEAVYEEINESPAW